MGWLFNMGVNIWVARPGCRDVGHARRPVERRPDCQTKAPLAGSYPGEPTPSSGALLMSLLGDEAARGYPEAFTFIGQGKITGTLVPVPVALFVVLALVFGLVLHKTTFGRRLYAIGNNEQAARYSRACRSIASRSSSSLCPGSWRPCRPSSWPPASAAPGPTSPPAWTLGHHRRRPGWGRHQWRGGHHARRPSCPWPDRSDEVRHGPPQHPGPGTGHCHRPAADLSPS